MAMVIYTGEAVGGAGGGTGRGWECGAGRLGAWGCGLGPGSCGQLPRQLLPFYQDWPLPVRAALTLLPSLDPFPRRGGRAGARQRAAAVDEGPRHGLGLGGVDLWLRVPPAAAGARAEARGEARRPRPPPWRDPLAPSRAVLNPPNPCPAPTTPSPPPDLPAHLCQAEPRDVPRPGDLGVSLWGPGARAPHQPPPRSPRLPPWPLPPATSPGSTLWCCPSLSWRAPSSERACIGCISSLIGAGGGASGPLRPCLAALPSA
jgi:hypothetical protein